MDKFVIFGLGTFGKSLALELIEKGAEVVAIDSNMDLVEEIQESVTYSACLDSTDRKAIEELGPDKFDVAVVCIGENFEANLLTAVLIKQLGVKRVIARASDDLQANILLTVGIDQIVSPEEEAAKKLTDKLILKTLLDITYLADNMAIAKIEAPKSYDGKTIGELDLRAKKGVNVLAIHRAEKKSKKFDEAEEKPEIVNNPGAGTVIHKKDTLIVIGETNHIEELS